MKEILKMVLSQREDTTLPITVSLSKSAEESINQFAETHDLEYEVALEAIIVLVGSNPDYWKDSLFKD